MFLSLQHFHAAPSTFILLQPLRIRAERVTGKAPLLFVYLIWFEGHSEPFNN